VTIAAGLFRKSGLINYSRGKIKVLDRKGLETAACECYQILFDGLIQLHQQEA
jgi:hypothetical protein